MSDAERVLWGQMQRIFIKWHQLRLHRMLSFRMELCPLISKLQEEGIKDGNNQINLLGISKELKPSEVLVRNSPKVMCTRSQFELHIEI